MKFYLIAFTALLLTACGGSDDKSATASALADANQPNVVVPTDRTVIVTDYACTETRDYTDAIGDAKHRELPSKGVIHYWKDSGYSLSYDEDADGRFKTLSKYQRYTLDGGQYRLTSEFTDWELKDGAWSKSVEQIERVWRTDGNFRHIVSNKVNGADAPYYWDLEETRLDAKTTRQVKRHTNPSVRDHDGLHYTKIEISCTNTDR